MIILKSVCRNNNLKNNLKCLKGKLNNKEIILVGLYKLMTHNH